MKTLTVLAIATIVLFNGCTKNDEEFPVTNESTATITLCGRVLDETNAPLGNVSVVTHGNTTTTNAQGIFVLVNVEVNKTRCLVQLTKAGFSSRAHAFKPAAGTANYIKVVLDDDAPSHSIASSSGGTITLTDGMSVQIQPGSFITGSNAAYNGTVNMAVKHLSPDQNNFSFMIPGGDLAGRDAGGNDVALYSYGMTGVTLTGNNNEKLQLAAGATATITFPIAASQLSTAPATIPLWYFDEATSLWKEEGFANKVGSNYVGTVSHFSWWNCDIPFDKATISGTVKDCNGNLVPNVVVTFTGNKTLITDQNGVYQNWVPAGIALTAQVLASNNGGLFQNSQLENIPALLTSQSFVVPDLIIPCPTSIAGVLKACNGSNTPGTVIVSNTAGFFNYQYTSSGSFSVVIPAFTQVDLRAYNPYGNVYHSISSQQPSSAYNAGNLLLCDTSTIPANAFVLDGYSFHNQLFVINPDSSGGHSSTQGQGLDIALQGAANTNYQVTSVRLHVNGNVPGTYPWNCDVSASGPITGNGLSIYLDDYFLSSWYGIVSMRDTGSVFITQVGAVGGRIKGHYAGYCSLDAFGIPLTGYYHISGNFDVPRTF